jgi:hypothetical protein
LLCPSQPIGEARRNIPESTTEYELSQRIAQPVDPTLRQFWKESHDVFFWCIVLVIVIMWNQEFQLQMATISLPTGLCNTECVGNDMLKIEVLCQGGYNAHATSSSTNPSRPLRQNSFHCLCEGIYGALQLIPLTKMMRLTYTYWCPCASSCTTRWWRWPFLGPKLSSRITSTFRGWANFSKRLFGCEGFKLAYTILIFRFEAAFLLFFRHEERYYGMSFELIYRQNVHFWRAHL